MRIFILPGTLNYDNVGDLAMLQAALRRLKTLWPEAVFLVLTAAPEKLKFHCPEAVAVPWRGCKRWLAVGALPRFFFPGFPRETRRLFPPAGKKIRALARLLYPPDGMAARRFASALVDSDLVVMTGCGLITDSFQFNALRMLDVLGSADRYGIPTAMFGQGLGPIQSEKLWQRAAKILPRVGAIFLRERRAGPALLEKLRVPKKTVAVTGDDAVEFAFKEKSSALGHRIGVNWRRAGYAALDRRVLEIVRDTLVERARRHGTSLAGIPILTGDGKNSDVQTLRSLVGVENAGGELDSPLKVIRQIADCRVVVAASYHAGVFALAQGIPVVGVVQSDYYRDKFKGLAGEFGEGCVVLRAEDADFSNRLGATLDELWARAGELKPKLLAAAERQIQSAQAAYAGLPDLLPD